MKNYKINFTANTLIITKAFETAANTPTASEYKLLAQIKTDYPAMTITRKTHRSANVCNVSKGLTYAHMARYIKVYENAAELLERFEQVKELAAAQTNSYLYVKSWFVTQFPNYKALPDFTTIKPIAAVVPAPIAERKAA